MGDAKCRNIELEVCYLGTENLGAKRWSEELELVADDGGSWRCDSEPLVSFSVCLYSCGYLEVGRIADRICYVGIMFMLATTKKHGSRRYKEGRSGGDLAGFFSQWSMAGESSQIASRKDMCLLSIR